MNDKRVVIDLRGRADVIWEEMPNVDLSVCVNKSILEYVYELCERNELPDFRKEQLRLPASRNYYIMFYDNVGDASERNVNRMKESGFRQFAFIEGFCTNSHEHVVSFLLAYPEYIRFPSFLANSHPRAVAYCVDWLRKQNHLLNDLHIFQVHKYLHINSNPDMFHIVWNEFPELCPISANTILAWTCLLPNVQVLF